MPMPIPAQDEDQAAFMQRCMSDEAMQAEFPDEKQRAAVCMQQYSRRPAALAARAMLVEPSDGEPPEWIMYMPGGMHTIHASRGDEPVVATVMVDRDTAAVMQQSLASWLAAGRRPYIDLDHDHGGAAGWVQAFEWRDDPPGVWVRVEWSSRGREAILGKVYRYFSPSFYASDEEPARVIGAPLDMGGLVNDPAFERIQPIWSKRMSQTPTKDTKDTATLKEQLDAARAELAALKQRADANEDAATRQALEAAQNRVKELEAALEAAHAERAEAALRAAIERGALPAADEALHARWRRLLMSDPSAAALLAALPGHPAIQRSGQRLEVIREDAATVLRAYEAARDHATRGKIYAREIRPRIERGEPLPLEAANSLGTLAGTLVVQRSLDLLKERYPLLQRISTDLSDQPVAYGQTVVTRTRAIPAAADYSPTTGYATQDAQATDVPVTIDTHKAVQVRFSANELAGTSRRLLDEWTEPIHAGLADAIVASVYGLITAANYPNATTQALSGFGRGTVTAMAKALNSRKVSPLNRTLLLNPDYYEKLAQDTTIVQLAAYQRPEAITEYRLPRIAGFDPFEAISLPTGGNLVGAGFAPDAIVVATRPPNDYTQAIAGANFGIVQTVTNPDTGLTVMVTQYIDHNLGAAFLRVALMWGVAVGQAASLQRLTSA